MKMYHEHPLRILRYSMRNIWLLIFPLLRGLTILQMDAQRFYEWIKGAWLDIAILGLISTWSHYYFWLCKMVLLEDIFHR